MMDLKRSKNLIEVQFLKFNQGRVLGLFSVCSRGVLGVFLECSWNVRAVLGLCLERSKNVPGKDQKLKKGKKHTISPPFFP